MTERQEQMIYDEGFRRGYEKGKADRPKGEWIDHPQYGTVQCDQCNSVYNSALYPKNFCPYCGAKMKGDNNETD